MQRDISFYEDFEQVPEKVGRRLCSGCAFETYPDECTSAPDCVPGPDNKLTHRVIFVRKVPQ